MRSNNRLAFGCSYLTGWSSHLDPAFFLLRSIIPKGIDQSRTTTTMARALAALWPVLLLLLSLAAASAFVVPPAPRSSSRSGSGRLHVLDPAALPDPATVDAAVATTQQAAAAIAGGGGNGANQVLDALRGYVFSPSGFGAVSERSCPCPRRRRRRPRLVLHRARRLCFLVGFGLTPTPSPFHAQTGLLALGIRMYTYFTAQSMMARLVTLFAKGGTTVELAWGNSLRNLWYYENKVCTSTHPDSRGRRFSLI